MKRSKIMQSNINYAIFARDVVKVFPAHDNKGFVKVLNRVNLKVRRGEFVTLVGPSGCGKSTLLKLILGDEAPTSGMVFVNDSEVREPNKDRGIVFQDYSLFPHMTIVDNIAVGLEFVGFNLFSRFMAHVLFRNRLKQFKTEAYILLEKIGLGRDDADKYPNQLSGGMRQRVAIAQSLITKPSVLLMDEPFGALDNSTRKQMQQFVIERWRETKKTIIFVTHDLKEAVLLGTRIVMLSQYYSSDDLGEGARIVLDKETHTTHELDFQYTSECSALLKQLEKDGLDKTNKQHDSTFDLSHPDAYPLDCIPISQID
jgi:NitT/TauT family transport system ATP-binding protein